MILNGRGETNDVGEGMKWLEMAASNHHGSAQFALGTAYVIGTNVKQDMSRYWSRAKAISRHCQH
jgi:TPR repeat protein